ncbi:MAG: glycosyltransferase family 4 protein [Pyrinomonadaceae bacterium]|nr:glycosyltransferase family 4 protein [Pyrinomonadaceae bacterium]
MKILHFLDTVNRGGAETLVLDVCRNAEKSGIEIFFANAGGGALEEDFRNSDVKYFRLNRRLPFDPLLVSGLRKILRENGIDIIHTHQAVEGLHAVAAVFGLKTKVVLTHHGIVPDKKNLLATKFLLKRVAHNILVGRESKKTYERDFDFRFPEKTSVIYNGVDEMRLRPSRKNFREEIKISNDALLIGMVGNFYPEPRKDQMTLCRALPKIFNEMPNVRCVFAGKIFDGAEDKFNGCVQFCEANGIAEKVHFLGARNDIPDILAALDVFVCSSLAEGLPIAVNEAMLTQTPTLVSDIPPLLEASKNGEFSEVFKTQNAEELSEKVLNLLKNTKLREDLGNRALKFAKENFSIEAHLKNLKNLYEKILEKK